jgi:hypothetical protein
MAAFYYNIFFVVSDPKICSLGSYVMLVDCFNIKKYCN